MCYFTEATVSVMLVKWRQNQLKVSFFIALIHDKTEQRSFIVIFSKGFKKK